MLEKSRYVAGAVVLLGLAACGNSGDTSSTASSSSVGGEASSTTSGNGGSGGAGTTASSTTASSTTATSTTASSTTSSSTASSASSSAASSSASGGPPAFAKRVFVTSATYTGNLKLQGSGADGLDGGDKLCQLAASAATLGGTWRAWLSTTTVNAIDRIADVGPWYRLDGAKVFNNKASIVTSGPLVAIDVDEVGGSPKVNTWTGTKKSGIFDSFSCHDWTDEAPVNGYEGIVGITVGVQLWTESSSNPCHLENTLYCFEQ
jgi:hypothetical protein